MMLVKGMLLLMVFIGCSYAGRILSDQYKKRVEELKEMKKMLLGLETKMKYTYEILPEIFLEIAQNAKQTIKEIFEKASSFMKEKTATEAWVEALQTTKTNMAKEDIEVLEGFGKLLGKTDMEGQVGQIELTNEFLDTQIGKAEKELAKNEKLYKTLGTVCGIAFVILLI